MLRALCVVSILMLSAACSRDAAESRAPGGDPTMPMPAGSGTAVSTQADPAPPAAGTAGTVPADQTLTDTSTTVVPPARGETR